MKEILFEEFSRALSSRRYWLVFLLAALSFTCGFLQVMNVQAGSSLGPVLTWQMILVHGRFGYFAALMAALPFADSLITDTKHHFLDQILMRSRFRDYLTAKILAVAGSGLVAVLAPVLLLLLACILLIPSAEAPVPALSWGGNVMLNNGMVPSGNLLINSLAGYAIISLLMAACFGSFYSLLGLAVSAWVRNPFVVLAFPFLLYCVGSYVLPASSRLSWLGSTGAALLPSDTLISAVVQYLVITVFSLAFILVFARKERLILR